MGVHLASWHSFCLLAWIQHVSIETHQILVLLDLVGLHVFFAENMFGQLQSVSCHSERRSSAYVPLCGRQSSQGKWKFVLLPCE